MDRRSFLKLAAVTGAGSVLAGCGEAEHTLIRFIPEDELTPGVAEWKASICPLCPSGCGLTVRVMDADVETTRGATAGVVRRKVAKKLEGNPAHPINRGGLCPRGHAAIQVTYHPDRIAQPLKRSGDRGSGHYEAITWDEAIGELVASLDRIAAAGRAGSVAFLTTSHASHRRHLIERFLSGYGAPPATTVELFSDTVLRRANVLSFGHEQLPTFDLARTMFVLNFGADALGTWNAPVSHGAGYGAMRRARRGVRGTLVQIEARMSYTGANADEWIGLAPGREGLLALALAHVILARRLATPDQAGRAGRIIDGWSSGLDAYAPGHMEAATGIRAERIEELAVAFAETRPAVAMIAGSALAQTNGLFNALAVNALNALVGSIETPGGLYFTPPWPRPKAGDDPARRARPIDELAAGILASPQGGIGIEAVLLDGADPVYASPPAWRVREALARVPFIASFGNFLDDTSVLADLILPDHSFLESWVDALPESGSIDVVASVAAPVMRPLLDTRATPDVLLEVGRRMQRPLNPPLPYSNFEAMLRSAFASTPAATDTSGDGWWRQAIAQGGWWEPVANRGAAPAASGPEGPARPLEEPAFDGNPAEYPFHFLPYASQAFADGSTAHLPWLQEMPDPLTSAMWSSWIEINPEAARRLDIASGDIVEVASTAGSLRAPAVVSPGVAPDVVAMPAGQGHRVFTRYASGRGANPVEIVAPMKDANTGALAWAATRVRVARVSGPDGSLVQFAGSLRESDTGRGRR